MISVVIIEDIRRKEQERNEPQRPVLHIDKGPQEHRPLPSAQTTAPTESNRGVAIIDFSI